MSDYPKTPNLKTKFITAMIEDSATAGQIYVVPGFAGKIKKAWSALNGAITTADEVLTLKIGGTAVTGGAITIATVSSAAGDVDSCTPTALNTFTAGQAIEIENSGASDTQQRIVVTLELEAI